MGKKTIRLAALLLVTVLAASLFSLTAFADTTRPCATCSDGTFTATNEFQKISETQCVRLYRCSNNHKQPVYNLDGTYRSSDVTNHVPSKKATCTEAAICGNCGKSYGAPLEHKIVVDKAVAATCKKTGLTEGKHCSRCGLVLTAQKKTDKAKHSYGEGVVTKPTCSSEGYTTYTCKVCGHKKVTDKVKQLSHWYDLWEPAGNGTNSAPCKRTGCTYVKTTACVDWSFKLIPAGAEEAEKYSVCPVCGETSEGGRLELVEDAYPTPVTGWTPEGDMVLRCGELNNGEKLICVGFEFDARLVCPSGTTKFTIPAELVEGCKLMLLNENGEETELELENKGDSVTFTLEFTYADNNLNPVRMIHVVAEEA